MGERTNIAWTRSTRNIWSGCKKIGPGCDLCYAESQSRRIRGVNPETGEALNWGDGERVFHGVNAEKDIRKWNELCALERGGGKPARKGRPAKKCFTEGWPRPGFWPVFINSFSDTFDNQVPDIWRGLLWTIIDECPYLEFQIVTKRIGNVEKMLPEHWEDQGAPKNVWLIITVVDQQEFDRDWPKLMRLAEIFKFSIIGLSIEPQLGEIDVLPMLRHAHQIEQIVWGIVGGESAQPGRPARPFVLGWGKRLASDFSGYGQPFFFKQTGSNPTNREGHPHPGITGKGDKASEWPAELCVQQFPA